MYICYANPKRKKSTSGIDVFENFFIHETMLSKPRIFTAFRRAQRNTSIISRKSTESRMTNRMGFYKNYLKSAKSTKFGRMVPREWEIIFYQLYRFQKMSRRMRPKIVFEFERRLVECSRLYYRATYLITNFDTKKPLSFDFSIRVTAFAE